MDLNNTKQICLLNTKGKKEGQSENFLVSGMGIWLTKGKIHPMFGEKCLLLQSFIVLIHKILITWRPINITEDKFGMHCLNQGIKVTSLAMAKMFTTCSLIRCTQRNSAFLMQYPHQKWGTSLCALLIGKDKGIPFFSRQVKVPPQETPHST